ncbi:reverse transcriptase-like protein [Aquibacillus kalidii]|uniref:reverse transcriptase-like protein n=1 Tax=Aquibacillus kalidii TaxID=2762597 RepID=UPI0016495E48|nr:reverse transcriptase-like protein [Aquibacillus kalidii]
MNVRIQVVYKTPKGLESEFNSDEMKANKALLLAEDMEKTGRVKELLFVDNLENSWNKKELKKYLEGIQTEPHNVIVFFDGGFDLETKHSGLGCAIYYEQNGRSWRLRKNAKVDQLDTNNEAEYAALQLAIQELELLGVHHMQVSFIGDSQVVVNQLEGEWPVYEEELNKWIDRIESHLEKLGIKGQFEQVSRKRNREADHLASQALKGIEITSAVEMKSEDE